MRVSFVVTIYNKVPYIPYLLAGLSAQGGEFDREFIFVDDGSTDGSADLLRTLTRDWENVTILSQVNAGPSFAFNRGIAAAQGDLIKPMDGDDILVPGAMTALLQAMASTGLAVAFGTSHPYSPTMPDGLAAILANAAIWECQTTHLQDTLRHSLKHTLSNPSGWLARTDLVKKSGACDVRVFIQDISIELRMARLSDFARVDLPIYLVPEMAPGRLSDNEAQILHDCNLATSYFVADYPDLPPVYRRLAIQRALGRAWKWHRRKENGRALSSRTFWAALASRFGWSPPDTETMIALTCQPFRRTHAIRLPALTES